MTTDLTTNTVHKWHFVSNFGSRSKSAEKPGKREKWGKKVTKTRQMFTILNIF